MIDGGVVEEHNANLMKKRQKSRIRDVQNSDKVESSGVRGSVNGEISLDIGRGETLLLPARVTLVGGLKIPHFFSESGIHPYDQCRWEKRNVSIMDYAKGKPSFHREGVEVPCHWSENSVRITSAKYLFGAEVGQPEYEDSLRHPFDRIANTYTIWGWKNGYFATLEDAKAYNWEIKAMLLNQIWAPNSPVWFNIGHWEQWRWGRSDLRSIYANKGNKAYKAHKINEEIVIKEIDNSMAHPQLSACFLTELNDSMESILSHGITEGRIFSSGSGVGVNISTLRSSHEPISGRGKSSGPISFNKGWDRMAGAVKSGGRSRRAARMVIMDSDHPDVFDFLRLKNSQEHIAKVILREHNSHVELKKIAEDKVKSGSDAEKVAASFILSLPLVNTKKYAGDMDGEIYGDTISDQNANHSISLRGDFWKAYWAEGTYSTRWVTNPDHIQETFKASQLLEEMSKAVYDNAEPGCHNNDYINLWSPVKSKGRINTSNPCSEYLFANNTSCNLASFNAYRFLKDDSLDIHSLRIGARLAMIAADLNIEEGGFPTPEIAEGSYVYRTTGIGFGNIGGLLMSLGIPYDSDEGRFIAGLLTSELSASCWKASEEMGREIGCYYQYPETKTDLQEVLELHKACHRMLLCLPEIAAGKVHSEKKIKDLVLGKKLPQAEGLTGSDALRALARSFKLLSPWDQSRLKSTKSMIEGVTWDDLNTSSPLRNSFVSLYAPMGCLEGNTLVTTDKGLRRLKRLGNPNGDQWQDIELKVQTDEGPKKASKFYINGRSNSRIVKTRRGAKIQGTEKHQIKKLNPSTLELEWVKMKDVVAGDILPSLLGGLFGKPQVVFLPDLDLRHGNNSETVKAPEVMDKKLSEFVGLFMGDGSIHTKGIRISCYDEDKDLIEYIRSLGKQLFAIEGKIENRKDSKATIINFNSSSLANWFVCAGFAKKPKYGTYTKQPHIPNSILETNDPEIYGAFVRGVAEADGTIRTGTLPSISTHSETFAQELISILLSLGIAPTMDGSTISGKSGKNLYRVGIRNHDYLFHWKKYCGFLSRRKLQRQNAKNDWSFSRNDYIAIDPLWLEKLSPETKRTHSIYCAIRNGRISKNIAKELVKLEKNTVLGKKIKRLLGYVYDAVESNQDGGAISTYDLSVPENVTYIANGFVSHNTISAPLGIYDEGTTSAEPDYTLVKYKSLSGGGSMTMFNSLALIGLKTMGYNEFQVREAALEVAGVNGLIIACEGNKGAVVKHLKSQPDEGDKGPVRLEFEKVLERGGENIDELISTLSSGRQTDLPSLVISGRGNVEAIPWLPSHHKEVFDCAATTGGGSRAIAPDGHIRMLGALMPFISGAVSKTVNLPHYATEEDILECFEMSHKMGVKCIALYRADSKGVSVFAADSPEAQRWSANSIWDNLVKSVESNINSIKETASQPRRRKLPGSRNGQIIKFEIAGSLDGFIVVGTYPDGRCGEVFGRLGQGGSFAHGMFESFCKAFSVMLQWGVPLQKATDSFKNLAFDPAGFVKVAEGSTDADIKSCKSVVDLMMKILEWLFPLENGSRLRGQAEPNLEIDNGTIKLLHCQEQSAFEDPEGLLKKLGAAEMCPECHGLSVIQDGKCKRCTNCGFSSGGCGG